MITRHKHWTAPLRRQAQWVLLLGGVMPILASARPAGPIDPLAPNSLLADQMTKLTAADGATNDYLGISVAVSGDTVVVGTYGDDSQRGSAYVFYRHQGGSDAWGQVTKLVAAGGAAGDSFGIEVAIDDDTIVVGAYGDDSARGSAYVFYRDQGGADQWGQVARLTAADGAAGDDFGYRVSVSGDTVVISAPHNDGQRGAAYVFGRDQGGADQWGQVAKLTAADGAVGDHLGYAVAISGDTVVAGAFQDDSDRGSAYVFERNQGGADAWGQVDKLIAADGAAGDHFGYSMALTGNTLVVGAYLDDDPGADSGSAYIYYQASTPDLALAKGVAPAVAVPGQTITYTLSFSNAGAGAAMGVVLTDTLPLGLTPATVLSSGVSITQQAGTRYVWDVADLAPGAGGIITLAGVLSKSLSADVFTNTATIATTIAETVTLNNSASVAITVTMPDPARIRYLPLVVFHTCYPYCP